MTETKYEVCFPNNPIEGYSEVFDTRLEALQFADECEAEGEECEVYMVMYDDSGVMGNANNIERVQIRGSEVDAELADKTHPDSCEADLPDNFRAPKLDDDDMFEECKIQESAAETAMNSLLAELDKPISDEEVEHYLDDDMSDEEFEEGLGSIIKKRHCNESTCEEDAAGMIDDSQPGKIPCAYCGSAFTRDVLTYDEQFGLVCPKCLEVIETHRF